MVWLLACADAVLLDESGGGGEESGTDSETGPGGDSDSDAGTDTDTATDSGTDTAPPEDAPVFAVHPDVHTLITVDWVEDGAADEVWLAFRFEGDAWMESPVRAASAGPHHEVLLGLPADTTAEVVLHHRRAGVDEASPVYTVTTGSLPAGLPVPAVVSHDESLASAHPWLLGSVDAGPGAYDGPMWTFILDRKGRVVWYFETSDNRLSLYAQVAADGTHVLIDMSTLYVWDDTILPGVTRVTLDHGWAEVVDLPDFGLALDELPDGTLIYEGASGPDKALVTQAPDGTRGVVWNCTTWHEERGFATDSWSMMPNTVVFNPDQGTVLWSMFTTDTILEVEVEDGEVVGQYGQLEGGWSFDPPESVVDYQHYPNYTPDGRMIVSTHVRGVPNAQRTREFEVDPTTRTLREVWTFGEGVDHYATYAGEAQRLDNGNRLVGYGTDGALLEVTEGGEVAWEVQWTDGGVNLLIGHMSLFDDLYALNEGPG